MSIQNFTDLDCWKACRDTADWIFAESKKWPEEEKYGLRQSINTSARKATRNLAKGHRQPNNEALRYCRLSAGALAAVHDDLITAQHAGYLEDPTYQEGKEILDKSRKLVGGYIRFLKPNKEGSNGQSKAENEEAKEVTQA